MHNSFEGSANVTGMAQYQSGPYLLKAQDQSGACLNCHEAPSGSGYHVSTSGVVQYDSTVPANMTPGGDFAWLKKTMTGSVSKAATTWQGDRHGHNIIATDFGYTFDKTLTTAPGGSYDATKLACSSCHDPHGKYRRFADGTISTTGLPIFNSGSYTDSAAPIANVSAVGVYRLLAGVGYAPKSYNAGSFGNPSPDAVAPASYNGASTTIAGTFDRVAYGRGMSEWCANCHTSMHKDITTVGSAAGLVHPAGNGAKLSSDVVTSYNTYVSSGVTGTPPNNGYSALAPFEIGVTDSLPATYANLATFVATPNAAATTNNVNCLACHRSHASAFGSMARYALSNEFMTVADSANTAIYDTSTTENGVNMAYNTTQQTNAYNGRPANLFGPYARNYCNKCHAKD
jgi:hypothetical protein